MVSAGSYILSVALLAALVCSLGFAAVRLRRRLLPDWDGAPARLVETIVAVALLVWLSELLGLFGLFYSWALVAAAVVVAAATALALRGAESAATKPEGGSVATASGGADLGGVEDAPARSAPPEPHH